MGLDTKFLQVFCFTGLGDSMNRSSQKITIEEFHQLMKSDGQAFPAFLRKIADVARPADVRMLKASGNSARPPQTSWTGWWRP
jgi:hypothetical protein